MSITVIITCNTVFIVLSSKMCGDRGRKHRNALFFSSARSPDGKSLEENESEWCTAPLGKHKAINAHVEREKKQQKTTHCKLHSYNILTSFDSVIYL